MARRGYKVGILDADITGPSIPKAFGLTKKAHATDLGIMPEETHMGIKVMSINLLLENADQPVVWRGPVLSGAVATSSGPTLAWGELDVLFIDMPPGTGDVPLTIYQSLHWTATSSFPHRRRWCKWWWAKLTKWRIC